MKRTASIFLSGLTLCLVILWSSLATAAPAPEAKPAPATGIPTVATLLSGLPAEMMPPGVMSDDEANTLRQWAERQSGTLLAAELVVDKVESKVTGITIVSGCVPSPFMVCGRTAKCSMRVAIPDGQWKGLGTVVPGATISLTGKLAAKEPLKPGRGSVPVGTGKMGVTGWTPTHAFFEMQLEDCQPPVVLKAPQVPAPTTPTEKPKEVPTAAPKETPAAVPKETPKETPKEQPKEPVAVPTPVEKPVAATPAAHIAGSITFLDTSIENVGKIVYILDRSGSMADSIDVVKAEVVRSIKALTADQQFHVIFYSSGPPVQLPRRALVPATDASKDEAVKFLDTVLAQGETDPTQALKDAFALKPDTICLLTDGEFDRQVVDLVKQLNTDGKVRVYTFAFQYKTGEALLKQIADENGGKYKYISERDIEPLQKE
jgi:hypothetical protein